MNEIPSYFTLFINCSNQMNELCKAQDRVSLKRSRAWLLFEETPWDEELFVNQELLKQQTREMKWQGTTQIEDDHPCWVRQEAGVLLNEKWHWYNRHLRIINDVLQKTTKDWTK